MFGFFIFLQTTKRRLKTHLFMVSLEKNWVFSVKTSHHQWIIKTYRPQIKKNAMNSVMVSWLSRAPVSLLWCSSSADYETLRIGGLAFAVVLFTLGILLILSKLTSVSVSLYCCCCCLWPYLWRHHCPVSQIRCFHTVLLAIICCWLIWSLKWR